MRKDENGTEWYDIGCGVEISYYVDNDGKKIGVIEAHLTNGKRCVGSVPFKSDNGYGGHAWNVISLEPLTLEPSILCQVCGHHGFIRDGKWVPA